MRIILREYLKYKFLNSVFAGLSMGAIFTIYAPLPPMVFSVGGIFLALGLWIVAKMYQKISTIGYFYAISIFVEIFMLIIVVLFLLFKQNIQNIFAIYILYQIIFIFGGYLWRFETIFVKRTILLSFIDISKQKGYLTGLLISIIFYWVQNTQSNVEEVYKIYIFLFFLQLFIVILLFKSFKKDV